MLAILLLSAVVSVRISVLLSYYGNDLFTALQVAFEGSGSPDQSLKQTGIQGFWRSIWIFAILAAVSTVRVLVDLYVMQRFAIRWRVWLSRRLLDDWLDGYAYFRGQLAAKPIDNPDQRIQQDIDIVTTMTGEPNTPAHGSGSTLLFGAVESVLSVASFGVILWHLSGPLTILDVTVPKALFWIVITYVLLATIIAFWIGRPLIQLSFWNELRNASFRYSMIRVKDAASAVGLYRGEGVERTQLNGRLTAIIANYRQWLRRMMLFLGWNVTASQAINPLPYIVQAQRLFAQQISFGDVMQSAAAFGAIHDALSFFRNAYDSLRKLPRRAHQAGRSDRRQHPRTDTASVGRSRSPPDGECGSRTSRCELPTGANSSRVSTCGSNRATGSPSRGARAAERRFFSRAWPGMWPYASGSVRLPADAMDTMFVSQLPYLPLGNLRDIAAYPSSPDDVSTDEVQQALLKVALPHLIIRINEIKDWAKVLSVGEQQRIAFARILLNRPMVVFLDEATSGLDEGLELTLYQLLRAELPQSIVVSVSHRDTVEQHHDRQLELLGDGAWRLDRLTIPG